MRKNDQRFGKRLLCAGLCLAILLGLLSSGLAAARPVTVAYSEHDGLLWKTENGSYAGLGADYLERIAAYTGWTYQFVELDHRAAREALQNGTADFYCAARRTEGQFADMDYSRLALCNMELNLYTLPQRDLYYEDCAAFNGLRIGLSEDESERACFAQYAEEKRFVYTPVSYGDYEEALAALNAGAADAVALAGYAVQETLKLVGKCGVSPVYLAAPKDSGLMSAFSRAQDRLYIDQPAFVQTLEARYADAAGKRAELLLTREEAALIAAAPPLTVAISVDMAPIEYYDGGTGAFRGVTIDLYRRIAEMTGLRFRFVRREDAPIMLAQMERGEVQLVGALAKNENVASALHIWQSDTFSQNSMTIVAKDFSKLTPASVAAVPAGYPQFVNTANKDGYTEVRAYPTFEECVRSVYDGETELAYIISMCEGYLLAHARYGSLRTIASVDSEYGICLGVSDGYDPLLLSVLNKCLAALPDNEIDEIIISNTAQAEPAQTLADFAAENSLHLVGVGLVVLAAAAFAVFRLQKARQQKQLNGQLREHHDYLQRMLNTLPCGVFQYAFEPPHYILGCNAACMKTYGFTDEKDVVGKLPTDVVTDNMAQTFLQKFSLCAETGRQIMYTLPIRRRDGTEAFTECVMDIVESGQGKVFQETFIDETERVTRENKLQEMYTRELTRSRKRDKGLLYTACFDVDEQRLTDVDIDVPTIRAGISVQDFVDGLRYELSELQTDEEIDDFALRFSSGQLHKDYEEGRYEQSFDLCRRKDGQIQWIRSTLSLRRNPSTEHLMCFDYIWDVTDEHVTGDVMRRLAFADCDYIISVFAATGRCLQYTVAGGAMSRTEPVYGETDAVFELTRQMEEEDARALTRDTALAVVLQRLSDTPFYQVFATLRDADGTRRDKSVSFFFLNAANGVVAATISDVTEIRASEARRSRLLADALAAAEKADAAKSRFLSRVSHEMRTPLNAIIGFIDLAKGADEEKTARYLASSHMAAKQLLNVINDVLDMSAIESGKLVINSTSFNFKQLVSSLTNIYGIQCKQKGLDFDVLITTPMEDWLVGDELRLNQVLVNLLGNAIKFTTRGRVQLTISQTAEIGGRTYLRFVVADTGCGISEQMKERLFQPFEQESTETARKYGGSGLGLSIVKSLVSLMSGSIRVESKLGEGTAFIVDLPFEKSQLKQEALQPRHIDNLRILVVDDEASEREYLGLVLQRLNVRHACVEGGREALEALAAADAQREPFNICLVDWRMPDMNGCETTRRIREKYGEEVMVIVVSAYDYHQAGASATEAGANLFLSKPVFQSSLYNLLMTLTDGQLAIPKEAPRLWDFAGRRVLLAEDNALNQVIEMEWLSQYRLEIALAEDGRQAVELFLASAPGEFDAILMDIQMPVMDGYEATKAIRASDHPDAKKIPIIAQTADAFSEDVTKALEAGMNDHIAKPIEPETLFSTLSKYMAHTELEKDAL